MVAAMLRGVRHMGNPLAAMLPRRGGSGCGIHFDAGGVQFVRITRASGRSALTVDACGSAVIDDGMLSGSHIAKPEAVARRIDELLERLEMSARELQRDTIVLALPSGALKTQVIDYPSTLPPRALRAWGERRAALLLPGDGDPDLRSRVGVTWAEPGSHRLRLYACEAPLADDRVAVLEMAGLRVHAIDAAHQAGRRAFRWTRTQTYGASQPEPALMSAPAPVPTTRRAASPQALLQIDAREVDIAVFDGQTCIASVHERFDGVNGHVEALASMIQAVSGRLPVALSALHIAAREASPGELAAIREAVATTCGVEVQPFDPLDHLPRTQPAGPRFHAQAQCTAFAVPFGLALRAVSMQGAACA
ncbi:pilus assembly protein PilM [Pandoraea anhela]|uniref:Pilus assembly protein PilM n=1 Tax=Pandoraea anhela TaxID=2508295 RepID=A0A5E4XCF3_9BURK|nr:pilus assembly protein PilM [Pandoraea anhela]VVE33953.1 hypothetical protein PAN31108_03780 [Pandoraea anhela]